MKKLPPAPRRQSAPLKVVPVAGAASQVGASSGRDRDEARPDEALVERAVRDLRALVVGGKVRILIEAGNYLIEHFYGSAAAVHSHNPRKAASLARLRERAPEFGMTASDLPRAVGVALQAAIIGRKVALRLRQEHHLALLPLRDPEEKKMLAATTVEEGWSAAHLRQKIADLQSRHPGGRPRDPALLVVIRRLDRVLAGVDVRALAASRKHLDTNERRHVESRLRAAEVVIGRLRDALSD